MSSRLSSVFRPLVLLGLLCIAVLCLGRWVLPAGTSLRLVVTQGYWWTLVTVLVAGYSYWRLVPPGWKPVRPQVATVVVIGLVSLCWQGQETFGFKILSDEIVLAGTAQNMHLDRDVGYGVRATDVRGPFEILQSVLDKRPLLFPFLVSVVHDITGYRVANAFWFNAVLGVVLLSLVHGLALRLTGIRWAGYAAVLLVGGIPLLAQQAAGGGFELLNLTLLVAWMRLAIEFLDKTDANRMNAFVMTAVLLACTRYESLLYLPVTALVVGLGWWRAGKLTITPVLCAAPVLVLPSLWLQDTFEANAARWELQSKGADTVFSMDYLPGNLGHAMAHFFSIDGYQPNSPIFAALGLLALPFFLLWSIQVWRGPRQAQPGDMAVAWTSLGLWAASGLMMVYFWGQYDHPVIHRLSLPTQLLMLTAILVVAGRMLPKREVVWKGLTAVAVAAMVMWSLPTMARNAYGRSYTPGLAYAWRAHFLEQIADRQVLVIDRDTQFWITQKISATPVAQAELRREGIAFHLRNRSFSDIFVFQTVSFSEETGVETIDPADVLSPAFELEPVAQVRLSVGQVARISRLTAIREDGEVVAAPAWPTPTRSDVKMDAGQAEAVKQAYIDNWIKQLP